MIARIVQLLLDAHYRQEAATFNVAGVDFSFDAVMSGPGNQSGIIVIARIDSSSATKIVRRLEHLLVSLSRTRSKRPVTAVIVSAVRIPNNSLDSVCSTFEIGPDEDPGLILAPLLPLRIPTPTTARESAESLLRTRLTNDPLEPLTAALLAAARLGAEDVRIVLERQLSDAATEPHGDVP